MWECAVEACKELVQQYEEQTYDLKRLSKLLRNMAEYYDKILTKVRPEPEYFRVGYYGRGFPPFLQNKVFIYRGKEYEWLAEFVTRTLNQLPKAESLLTTTLPGEDITESDKQYIQVFKVEPIMSEEKRRALGNSANSQVLKYYRTNHVQKFRYSRPFRKDSAAGDENEFATLWVERSVMVTSHSLPGILRWFPVTSTETYLLSPLANAIETMQAANDSLRELILDQRNNPSLDIRPLSMKIKGYVDPAVMGGITNYEKAFFTLEYLEKNPNDKTQIDKLKELIAYQIPLLEVGIKLHGDHAATDSSLQMFQASLETSFAALQAHVTSNYGVKSCDIKYESVAVRRQTNPVAHSNDQDKTNRLSGTSFGSTEGSGSRSRVSSLTRSQVATLKTFVNFGSMSPSSTLSRAGSVYIRSTSTLSSPSTRKDKKKKRRHTNKDGNPRDSGIETRPSSQWYTSNSPTSTPTVSMLFDDSSNSVGSPLIELRQQLTPTRPLRSEMEKERRLSRPASLQFSSKLSTASTPNGNRDSVGGSSSLVSGTTDSTNSEDEPPPLPAKTREPDYCNLPEEGYVAVSTSASTLRARNKPIPPLPIETMSPPTPPPKRPLPKTPPPDLT